MSSSAKSNTPLIVVVAGGGPVGLTFALNLTMMMGEKVKIIIYESRWFVDKQGKTCWKSEEQGHVRRNQVVTLQDHVIQQMPEYIQKGLFTKVECVWPTSRNIPIREVEDRLLELIEPFIQNSRVEVVLEDLHEQTESLIKGNFDILVGADGSNSFVRRYCNIQMISEGCEYACGVAFKFPDKPSKAPLHQALNCVLTMSQTRYMVNSFSNQGYLNVRLIQSEYEELREHLKSFQSNQEPLCLSDTDLCPQSPVWTIIRQGLQFFNIPVEYVFRVAPIEINIRHASVVVRELRFEKTGEKQTNGNEHKQYRTALAFLMGDAAMNVHFWVGRGMNSGMKAAMALARNLVRSYTSEKAPNSGPSSRFLDFLDYEGFMARLRAREQQGRSLRILLNPIDKSIEAAYSSGNLYIEYEKYKEHLLSKLTGIRDRLQKRPDWPHESKEISDKELKSACSRIDPTAVKVLSSVNPWPTREMSGIEVFVEDTYKYDSKDFLPVPSVDKNRVKPLITHPVPHRFIILWIMGDQKIDSITELVKEIENSPKFESTTNSTDQFKVVRTIEKAKEWMVIHRAEIRKSDVRFKVITLWRIDETQTAIDAIRVVRAEMPRAPVLIFINKHEDTLEASQFPNILTTDIKFDVKEFVGIKQETQWNAGHLVEHKQDIQTNTSQQQSMINTIPAPPTQLSSLPYPTIDSYKSSDEPFHWPMASNSSDSPKSQPVTTLSDRNTSKRLILWMDESENDLATKKSIEKNHTNVDFCFLPTFEEIETYLDQHSNVISEQVKIIICRGFYRTASKSFTAVAELLEKRNLKRIPTVVYTGNRKKLIEENPNRQEWVQICDNDKALRTFIDQNL